MRVVLTREAGLNEAQRSLVPPSATIYEVPLTTTHYYEASDVVRALAEVSEIAAVVVTSARAAKYAVVAHNQVPKAAVWSVGESTAEALSRVGVHPKVVGVQGVEELVASIDKGPVLFLGAKESRPEGVASLQARGIPCVSIPCYETLPLALNLGDQELLKRADVVFIGAPSAWSVAKSHVAPEALVVTSGETTAQEVRLTHENVLIGWNEESKRRLLEMAKSDNQ